MTEWKGRLSMDPLLLIILVLLIFYALGMLVVPVGNVIHILLVIVLVLIVYRLLTGRSAL